MRTIERTAQFKKDYKRGAKVAVAAIWTPTCKPCWRVCSSTNGCRRSIRAVVVRLFLERYDSYMSEARTLNISDARTQLAAIVDQARARHEPVYVTRRGRRVAAVIDADDLDRILALAEDMADIRAAEQAREELKATGEAPIPWDEVKADLGLA
jgi:prevent-host-death family protein